MQMSFMDGPSDFCSPFFPGFLNTNASPLSRGQVSNYGLMDQMAVLQVSYQIAHSAVCLLYSSVYLLFQWVRENAASFGGDPGRVTLLGHGTGAACVEYLAHSPTTVPGESR